MEDFPYRIVLFDLDGTLVDSQEGIVNGLQYSFAKLNLEPLSREELKLLIGPPLHEIFRLVLPLSATSQIPQAVSYYREYYEAQGVFEFNIYPYVLETLAFLQKKRVNLLIATLKPTKYAEVILNDVGIRDYFQVVTGTNTDVSGPVDKAALINHSLLELKKSLSSTTQVNHALMVGDRHHDIQGAIKNQLDSAWVTYGYGTEKDLEYCQPTHIIHSMKDLLALKTPMIKTKKGELFR